jgi:sugar phosphate isomerase/epimerase
MGVAWTCYTARKFGGALEFLRQAYENGAAGVQLPLREGDDPAAVRSWCEQHGMYFEGVCPLDGSEAAENALRRAQQAGAKVARGAFLSGRRYETFSRLDDWRAFVAKSREGLAKSVRLAEKLRIAVAVENHKDWTAAELAALMGEFSSEYLGVCLDTGNNLALLEEPGRVVETLAPWTISTHIKDLGLGPHPEGFVMAEAPLGSGMLDLSGMVARFRSNGRGAPLTLEMITRNPLVIPCLTPKYWVTFPERPGRELAAVLELVRSRSASSLPRVDGLPAGARADWEEENVRACLAGARERGWG